MRTPNRTRGCSLALACGLFVLTFAAMGCGHHHYEGDVVVDNRTDLTTNEMLLTFRMAAFGQPFGGDLLGGPLPVLSSRFIGTFHEGHYDAQGDLELGQVIEWFDEFVPDHGTTIFEVR